MHRSSSSSARHHGHIVLLAASWLAASASCSAEHQRPAGDAGLTGGTADGSPADGSSGITPPVDADGTIGAPPPPPGPCQLGARLCAGIAHERLCIEVDGEPAWVDSTCSAHSYCLTDRCQPGCLDECAHGDQRTVGGATERCRLYSTTEQRYLEHLGDGMHDLARSHDAWIRSKQTVNGYVADTVFADATLSDVAAHVGTVDTAEWTGTYLAAQALRLGLTRAPDAERRVLALIESLHQLFEVTGQPGYMARFWAPMGVDPVLDAIYEPDSSEYHTGVRDGQPIFWHGETSRDMYAGVITGYSLAYDAITSEKHREMIRQDVVTLAMELVEQRKQVPVVVEFKLGGWQKLPLNIDLQHVVIVPEELVDGAIHIQVGTDEDSSDYEASTMRGVREFLPDYTTVLKQVPVLGALLPPVPRPGSAIMLANTLRVALQVTDGVAAYAQQRAAIAAHYQGNIGEWLPIINQYVFLNASQCFRKYYGLTIVYHPLYNLLRLEIDAAVRDSIRKHVLEKTLWGYVKNHKNVYFNFITAGQSPGLLSQAEIDQSVDQLSQFPAPPKVATLIDNTGKYPADPDCPGQSTQAIDVKDRVRADFIWQRTPFRLVSDVWSDQVTYPGVDYLIAYWLGRHHGLIAADDADGTCLRWGP